MCYKRGPVQKWGEDPELISGDCTSGGPENPGTELGLQTLRHLGERESRDVAERESEVLSRQRVLKETFVQC